MSRGELHERRLDRDLADHIEPRLAVGIVPLTSASLAHSADLRDDLGIALILQRAGSRATDAAQVCLPACASAASGRASV